MSQPKITSKNLSYNSTLPPFLQRLQSSSNSSSLDGRHERAIARPKRARDANAAADDEPTYVDEETNNTLNRDEYEALITGQREDPELPGQDVAEEEVVKERELVESSRRAAKEKDRTVIGANRKRKVAKVIIDGGGEEADGEEKQQAEKETRKDRGGDDNNKPMTKEVKKKVKAKKLKLSFGDDDEG